MRFIEIVMSLFFGWCLSLRRMKWIGIVWFCFLVRGYMCVCFLIRLWRLILFCGVMSCSRWRSGCVRRFFMFMWSWIDLSEVYVISESDLMNWNSEYVMLRMSGVIISVDLCF